MFKFKDVFSINTTDVGEIKGKFHNIDTGNTKPISCLPIHLEERVNALIKELEKKGIIQKSRSAWNSPLVIVKKPNGDVRICVDYRRLNAATVRPIFPIPNSKHLLDTINGAKYFSSLDMSMGYYQIPLNPMDNSKTAFSTSIGQFEFLRMPFGLSSAPATFQRIMSEMLATMNWKDCLVYIDDILIFGNSLVEHNTRLVKVLSKVKQWGIKLCPAKCRFLKREVKYLGHIVSQEGISRDPEKVRVVK